MKQLQLAIPFFCVIIMLFASCSESKQADSDHLTLERFWNSYDFTDTAQIIHAHVGEKAVRDFVALVEDTNPSYQQMENAITAMLGRAEGVSTSTLQYFVNAYGTVLYDPNSPAYNESLYLPVLVYASTTASLPDYEKQRFSDRLKLIKRNNPGSKAANFSFRTADGKDTDLYSIKGRYVLLFFYEPGCHSCASALETMYGIGEISEWIGQGNLQILAVYANADTKLWKEYQPYIPSNWMNGIHVDQTIIANNLYDLKASPTFYLLDINKDVLLKDRPLMENLHYLDRALAQ